MQLRCFIYLYDDEVYKMALMEIHEFNTMDIRFAWAFRENLSNVIHMRALMNHLEGIIVKNLAFNLILFRNLRKFN